MAFKEVAGQGDTTIALGGTNKKTGKANPTSIEGYYIGSRIISGAMGDSLVHQFDTPKGSVDVWGKTDLDRKLSTIEVGTMTRVSYTGQKPIPGKNPMYTFKVEADYENRKPSSDEGSTAGFDDPESDFELDEAPLDAAKPSYTTHRAGAIANPSASVKKAKELLSKRG